MTVRLQWCARRGPEQHAFVRAAARLLLLSGFLAVAFWVVVYLRERLYQAEENRRFDERLSLNLRPRGTGAMSAVQNGAPWSRLEIPRLDLSVMVVEGVRPRDLKLAAGHVPGTGMPEATGNVVIAGHRDSFFRKLREVQTRDLITLTTLRGIYRYSVEWTRVVNPEDVEVMEASDEPLLTLVTCYPFYYVGPAPERFIVRARRLGGGS
jgi:sortase A